jgi:hypothetical protein
MTEMETLRAWVQEAHDERLAWRDQWLKEDGRQSHRADLAEAERDTYSRVLWWIDRPIQRPTGMVTATTAPVDHLPIQRA